MAGLTYTILIVDDEPDMLRSLRRIFEKEGYAVETAASAHELLNRSNWERFLAIILDRRLPDGNTDDLLPRIKEFAPTASIIIVTGYAELDSTITAFKFGVEDYLLKPVNPDVLKTRLRKLTEKKQMETQLRLSNRALEAAANGVVITDASSPDFPIIFVNEAFERITGYTREEIIGRNCRFLQRDDRNQADIVKIRHALKDAREFKGVLRNYRKDGSCFWNELFISPVRITNDKVTHFIGIQNDISKRKNAENALRQSEERFRQLAQNIDEVFWLSDPDKKNLLYVSPAYERIFGRPCASLYENPKSFLEAVHPDDYDRVIESLPRQRQGNYQIEYRILHTDGDLIWVRTRAYPVFDENGDVHRIAGITADVTRRKADEQAIQESEEQLQAIVNTAADAIITIERSGIIISFNAAAERMFGYSSGDVIGRNVNILMTSPYREEHDGYIARYLETHEARILGGNREVVAQRKNGSIFPIDLAVSEVGNLGLFTGIIRDLTDRKKAEEELEKSREELLGQTLFTQRLSALATMAGGISHELNQPLSSIGIYAATVNNLIKSKDSINTELISSSLKNINKQVDRAAGIINHMREFASEKKRQSCTAVNPRRVVENVLELLGQQLRNHNIKILNEVKPDVQVHADQTRLEQVFVILFSNARDSIDHTAYAPGKNGRIYVSSHVDDGSVLLRIEDNGSGVHRDVRSNLFEPFVTTKGPDRGMGLGLSICHGILKDYDAAISLEKTDENGSIFLLRFPSLKVKK